MHASDQITSHSVFLSFFNIFIFEPKMNILCEGIRNTSVNNFTENMYDLKFK